MGKAVEIPMGKRTARKLVKGRGCYVLWPEPSNAKTQADHHANYINREVNAMPKEIRALIRDYRDGKISRRDFMRRLAIFTGSVAAANALLAELMPHNATAQVDPGDPAILWHNIEYAGKAGPVYGYLARPSAAGKYPALVVIHANQGLNNHIRDVARRLAKEGYVTLTPDYLSRRGGTLKVNPKGQGLSGIRELAPWQEVAEDTDAGFAYLQTLSVSGATGEASSDFAGVVR